MDEVPGYQTMSNSAFRGNNKSNRKSSVLATVARNTALSTNASRARKTAFANAFRQVINTKSDILMSIMPAHMDNIAKGSKNHEYRKYKLAPTTKRVWFYISHPTSSIQYVAQISAARTPGQVPNDGGIGNEDFNAGKKVSKYGYEIRKLWRLNTPISLQLGRQRGYLKAPPQKYQFATPAMLCDFPLPQQQLVIDRTRSQSGKRRRPNEDHEVNEKNKIPRTLGGTDETSARNEDVPS